MTDQTVVPLRVEESSFNARWDLWVARGLEQDKQFRKRAVLVGTAILAWGGLYLVVTFLR